MAQRKAAAVSMDPEQHQKAVQRAQELGFSTFSAYVVALIRNDLIERGELTMKEAANGGYGLPPKKPKKN